MILSFPPDVEYFECPFSGYRGVIWCKDLEILASCFLLANSKRPELEQTGSSFKFEGSSWFFEGCGWLDGWSFIAWSCFMQSVHSHIPIQNGEKEQTGFASSIVSLRNDGSKQSIYEDF